MSVISVEQVGSFLGFNLPDESPQQKARLHALTIALQSDAAPTSLVSYDSSGIVALIGPLPSALAVAEELPDVAGCLILATQGGESGGTETREVAGRSVPIIYGQPKSVVGFLGKFSIVVGRDDGEVDLAKALDLSGGYLDIVLDLSREPMLAKREFCRPGISPRRATTRPLIRPASKSRNLQASLKSPGTCYTTQISVPTAHAALPVAGAVLKFVLQMPLSPMARKSNSSHICVMAWVRVLQLALPGRWLMPTRAVQIPSTVSVAPLPLTVKKLEQSPRVTFF